jgi:GTP-binding protein YchF
MDIISIELVLADLEVIDGRVGRIEKKALTTKNKEDLAELNLLKRIKEALENEIPARRLDYTEEEKKILKPFNLLTSKPIIYLANIREEDINKPNKYVDMVINYAKKDNAEVVEMCAKIESELSELNDDDKYEYLKELGMHESGLDKLIKSTYSLLGLATFFTVGSDEVKAWTFRKGMKAPECAGIIHSDFERGFIRAEVMTYNDLVSLGNELKVKEAGKTRLEGKEYIMQDGDICHFRFNV